MTNEEAVDILKKVCDASVQRGLVGSVKDASNVYTALMTVCDLVVKLHDKRKEDETQGNE